MKARKRDYERGRVAVESCRGHLRDMRREGGREERAGWRLRIGESQVRSGSCGREERTLELERRLPRLVSMTLRSIVVDGGGKLLEIEGGEDGWQR